MQYAIVSQPDPARQSSSKWASARVALILAYTGLYFLVTIPLAAKRLLWMDELYTFFLASSHRFGDIWNVLASGADAMPPAFDAITRAVVALPGPVELIIRLPEILSFWLMGVCLFEFTAARTSPVAGAIAAFLPGLMEAYSYAFEARSYAMVLGFFALALLSWQRADDRRWLASAGFFVGVVGAVAVHYYAILALMPIALAETGLWFESRRFRPIIWCGLAAGAVPVLLVFPLILGAAKRAQSFWAHASWSSILGTYYELLGDFFGALAVLVAIALVCYSLAQQHHFRPQKMAPPMSEILLAASLALLPAFLVIVARFTTGAYAPRYGIAMVLGVSILVAWGIHLVTSPRPAIATLILLAVAGLFAVRGIWMGQRITADRRQQQELGEFLNGAAPASLPIVIADPHLFVQLSYYAPAPVKERLVYLADSALALRYTGTDTVDAGLMSMRGVSRMRVEPFAAFLEAPPEFLTYGYPGEFAWIVPELRARGVDLEISGLHDGRFLLRATALPRSVPH